LLTVVGLGNPGPSYKKTRHNAGFMLLDGISDGRFLNDMPLPRGGLVRVKNFLGLRNRFTKVSGPYVSLEKELNGKRVLLVKPTTYMNESGKAFSSLKTKGIVKNKAELLVVVDDVDLPVGGIRIRQRGSSGGHNGLKSIVRHLGTDEFTRLRIGVGPRPDGDEMVEHVLNSFRPEEWEEFERSLYDAAEVLTAWVSGGYESAQERFSQIAAGNER